MYVRPSFRGFDPSKPINERELTSKPIQLGKYQLVYEFSPELDEDHRKKAREQLRENPEIVTESLKSLREMVQGRPDLIVPDDDEFFTRFLRPCKWHPKSAFTRMKNYYRYLSKHPDLFEDFFSEKRKRVFDHNLIAIHPKRDLEGCRVMTFICGKKWNPKEVAADDGFGNLIACMELCHCEPKTQINGMKVILDLDGLSFVHLPYITPSLALRITDWLQNCVPVRLKAIYIINQPYIFNIVWALFKPLLQEKFRKRMHFIGKDLKSLARQIGPQTLLKAQGGEMDASMDEMSKPIWETLQWFQTEFEGLTKFGYRNEL